MAGVEDWKKALAAYHRKQRTERAMGYRASKNPYKRAVGVRKAYQRVTEARDDEQNERLHDA